MFLSYVSPEDIALAKEMDLLTYLQNYEPQNLKRVARSTYCTREHDSLKISNGKWHWFSPVSYTHLDKQPVDTQLLKGNKIVLSRLIVELLQLLLDGFLCLLYTSRCV